LVSRQNPVLLFLNQREQPLRLHQADPALRCERAAPGTDHLADGKMHGGAELPHSYEFKPTIRGRLLGSSILLEDTFVLKEKRKAREQGSTLACLQRGERTFSFSLSQCLRKTSGFINKLHSAFLDDKLR